MKMDRILFPNKNKLIQDSNTEYGYHFTDEDFMYILPHMNINIII